MQPYPIECQLVVLDANCFRGCTPRELEAVRRRGFRLAVSIEGLREVWSQSIKRNKPGLLIGRVAELAPLLDQRESLVFAASALLTQIGKASDPVTETQDREFRENVLRGWRTACRGELNEETWRSVGADLSTELDAGERGWCEDLRSHGRPIGKLKKEIVANGGTPPEPTRFIQGIVDNAPAITVPPLRDRQEAFLAYLLCKAEQAESNDVARNDYCDARHLQQIARPAFLMTADMRIIETVERSSRLQRAWVRTPVELAEDRIARCVPWGRNAERACAELPRRDCDALARRLEAWRASLKVDDAAG